MNETIKQTDRPMWTYKGINIYPADRNSSGIRWYARMGLGYALKADTKEGMRRLITAELARK